MKGAAGQTILLSFLFMPPANGGGLDIIMGIKENLKALRKQHNLSQQELAKIAGVTDKAISTWESGTRIPRMGAIQKMADYFGLQKSDIIEDNSRILSGNADTWAHALETESNESDAQGSTWTHARESEGNESDSQLLQNAKRDLSPEDYRLVIALIKRLREK